MLESVSGHFTYPELAWVALAGVEPARLAVAWRAGESLALVRTLVEEARRAVVTAAGDPQPRPALRPV